MGLGSSRSRNRSDGSEQSTSSSAARSESSQELDRSAVMTGRQAERRYGVEITSGKQIRELQRMEQRYGEDVFRWTQEGMPIEAMGRTAKMEAFRERKGTPVPWDVEERNEQSVYRSKQAASDTSPAGDTGVPDTVREVISSQGRSLDPSIQRAMEDRMGDSFGDVRVHTGPTAAQACESIDARAFTVGNHVAFNQGEYDPESPEGQHVLAHELAHVRQQTQGAISMLPQEDAELEIDPDPALEREAEEAAQRAMAGGPVTVNRMGAEVHVQRWAGSSVSSQIAAERGETGYKSDPRATGTVASNHHYRHSADDSIDTGNLELSGDGSIEQLQTELDGALDRRYIGASLIVASVVAADYGEQVAQEKLADAFDLAPPQARAIVVTAGAVGAGSRYLLHRFDKYPVRWVASKLGVKAEVEEVLIRAGLDVPWAEEEPESVPDPEEVDG